MLSDLDVLNLVCNRLEQSNIHYMLTGSFASNFYAVPRMTRDIDIVLEILKPDMDKFICVFQNDFYIAKSSIAEAIDHQTMFNIIHNESIFKIDFIIRKDVSYRNAEFQRRRQILLNKELIWIVSPEDLIISKLIWAKDNLSQMQIKDVSNLMLSVKNLDKEYICDWVKQLNLEEIYQRVEVHE